MSLNNRRRMAPGHIGMAGCAEARTGLSDKAGCARACAEDGRGKKRLVFTVLAFITAFAPLYAQDVRDEKNEQLVNHQESLTSRITVDFKDMDVNEALHYLSQKAGFNIVSTRGVTGRVTMSLENIPMQDIFDLILRNNGLAYVKAGEVYQIMPEAEYKALYGKSFSDSRQVKIIRLQYAVPEQAFTMLEALKSDIGRVLVDQESGNVLLMDTPAQLALMERSLAQIEKQNDLEIFNLQYAKAKDVEEVLRTRLEVKKAGTVKADERNNIVIVQTYPVRMQEVRDLIAKLDRPTKQALIDVKIIKIKLSNQLDSSIEWEGIFSAGSEYGTSYVGSYPFSYMTAGSTTPAFQTRSDWYTANNEQIGSYPFSGTTSSLSSSAKTTLGENLHFGVFDGKKDYDVLFNFMTTLGETKVLANPKLIVINNQEAKIHIGEKQAYVTTTTTSGQTTSTIAEEVSFVDVGIQIAVTPVINDDGFVTMKIKPEISSVGAILITPTENRIPIIDTTLTETTVMVKDGITLLIGGLRKEEKTLNSEHLPFLGDIPFLKWIFRNQTDKVDRTEIVVMITPHIVGGNEFTLGEKGEFTDDGSHGYQDYGTVAQDGSAGGVKEAGGITIKPYQEYPGMDTVTPEGILAKGKKEDYEPAHPQ